MTAAYRRWDADATFVICLNAGEEPARLELALPHADGAILAPVTWPGWSWEAGVPGRVAHGRAEIEIEARAARVLRLEA